MLKTGFGNLIKPFQDIEDGVESRTDVKAAREGLNLTFQNQLLHSAIIVLWSTHALSAVFSLRGLNIIVGHNWLHIRFERPLRPVIKSNTHGHGLNNLWAIADSCMFTWSSFRSIWCKCYICKFPLWFRIILCSAEVDPWIIRRHSQFQVVTWSHS